MAETEIKKINGRTLSDDFARNEIKQLKESVDDLPDSYSKTESDNKYQPKGNYLTEHIEVDSELSTESENPVQNKVISEEINNLKESAQQIINQLMVLFYTKEEINTTLEDYVTQIQFNESAQQIISELLIAFYTKEQINEMLGIYVEEVASLVGGDA